jgi:uncharacterized protein
MSSTEKLKPTRSRAMLSVLIQLGIGLLFGLGLIISGMVNPAKVLNFLDIAGTWDPSLAFVMGGAVIVTFIGYKLVFKLKQPIFDSVFHLPTASHIDNRLVAGAAIFGIGWGLAGFCPGPAFTALGTGQSGTVIVVIAMIVGMVAARILSLKT